jgi:chromosome segregation ATPase
MEREDLPIFSMDSEGEPAAAAPPAPAPAAKKPAPAPAPRPAPVPMKPAAVAKPAAPAPAPAPADDPEALLREYAERQKTKLARLEQKVAEFDALAAERDALQGKADVLAAELAVVKKKLAAAEGLEAVNHDLQQKMDAALLAHSMLSTENAKLKMRVQEIEQKAQKGDERLSQVEKALADTKAALLAESEARKEAEARISAAWDALQPRSESKIHTVLDKLQSKAPAPRK